MNGGQRTGLGALATWGRGWGRTPGTDDGSRMWSLKVWAGASWFGRAVGRGLAVPLTWLWTPSRPGPVGCWLDVSREATVAGPGPGGSPDHRGCWLSTHDTHSSRPLSSRSRQLFILMTPKSQRSGKNGGLCGGHSMSTGRGGGRGVGMRPGLEGREPAPSSPALQGLS